jgi:hypothetical protein
VIGPRYGSLWSRRRTTLARGTTRTVSKSTSVVRTVRRATFGFASEPLGECAWTARDLT